MFIPLIFPRCLSPSCVYSCPHSIRHVSHFHTLNKALFFVTLSRFSCPLGPTTTTLARAHCHANATTEREISILASLWIKACGSERAFRPSTVFCVARDLPYCMVYEKYHVIQSQDKSHISKETLEPGIHQ